MILLANLSYKVARTTLIKQQFVGRYSATKTAGIRLRLTAFVAALLLTIMPLLTGCGSDDQSGIGLAHTVALEWQPVEDPSVMGYFVHYGRQSPNQPGSCAYEHSISVDSPSATITDLDPDTHYYFAVSAYNGLESACSNEVSIVTSPPSV